MLFTVALSCRASRRRLSTLAALVFAIAANPVLGDIMPVAMRDYPCLGGIVADAISIESGRETRVQNVNVRGARVGLHVMRGAMSRFLSSRRAGRDWRFRLPVPRRNYSMSDWLLEAVESLGLQLPPLAAVPSVWYY